MKVGLSRKFQLPGERFESHEVSVEFEPADWGYLDDDVQRNPKHVRLELLFRCHQVVLIDMVAEGRLTGPEAKKRLEAIRQVLYRQRDAEQTGDDLAEDMDTAAAVAAVAAAEAVFDHGTEGTGQPPGRAAGNGLSRVAV